MSNMTIFEGNPLVSSALFKELQEMNDNLSGGGSRGIRRISVRGGKFREMEGGEQVNVRKEDWINLVVVNAAKIGRTYYAGDYDPENPAAPKCWSVDSNAGVPAPEVLEENRQASRCADCPQNVKGSGQGNSRACRYSQRVAVVLEGKLDTVYQLSLAATSLFGEAVDGKMGMQAYARYLKSHNTPAIAVVTQAYFDDNSDTPKLFFKPVRPLEEAELKQVIEIRDSGDAIEAITMSVSQADGVSDAPAAPAEPPARKKSVRAKPKAEEPEEIGEPTKASTKKAKPEPEEDQDLQSIVDAWDD